MTGITIDLAHWLPANAAVGVVAGPGLIWLLHRIICVLELWVILLLLPREDRVTAVVAYFTSRSKRSGREAGAAAETSRRKELIQTI